MSLEELQQAFAQALRQPLNKEHQLSACPITEKAASYIVASPTLQPFSRMEIYAQQYWWRFFSTLQDQFPLVTALFGPDGFNELLVTPYIVKYPPMHWNLNYLGSLFTEWIKEAYTAEDKPLVLAAAQLDWSYSLAFLEKTCPLPQSIEETLYLTPTTSLFSWKWDLVPFRQEVLKQEVSWWIEHDFPPLRKDGIVYTLVRRTARGNVAADPLTQEEFEVLQQFARGVSLKDLCRKEVPYATVNRWIQERLLTPEKPPSLPTHAS